jgi:phosphohistidine swiveling domain-containing protein
VNSWLPDPSHYPEQMTPLSATVWFEAMGRGLHAAARELRAPFGGFATRTEYGWAYELELAPEWDPDPDGLRRAALELPDRWRDDLLPRVRAITEEIETMRPDLPARAEAAALFDRLWQLVQEQWRLHFLTVVPAQVAAEVLHDTYVARYPTEGELAAYRLLEGIANRADDAIRELAELARTLAVDDVIREFLPDHALQRLRESARGREWLHSLDGYLLRFGGRSRWHELSVPREAEHPALTLESLRLILEGSTEIPDVELPAPPPDLADLVAQVRAAYALKELHAYDIDYPGLLATREALLGFGRRLRAEGVLQDAEEIWMLERDEVRRAVAGEELATDEIVAARRDELARGLAEGPKPFLGEAPPAVDRDPALAKFYGTVGGDSGLTGAAASPGQAVGIARVVHGPQDVTRIEPGDILVTTTTTPAWTPLFASLGALVTETGGILSHAAVIAREYQIPAVVGVPNATRRVADGSRVRVDGSHGTIDLL